MSSVRFSCDSLLASCVGILCRYYPCTGSLSLIDLIILQVLQRHDAQADKEGTDDHGGKGDFPVSVFVEAVEILPALFFRGERDLIQVQGAVQDDREQSPQALGEGHAALFQQAEGNERHERGEQMHEQVARALQEHIVPVLPDAGRQEENDGEHRDGDRCGTDVLERPGPLRDAAGQGGDGRDQGDDGTERIALHGKEAESAPGVIRCPLPVLAEEGKDQSRGNEEYQ